MFITAYFWTPLYCMDPMKYGGATQRMSTKISSCPWRRYVLYWEPARC